MALAAARTSSRKHAVRAARAVALQASKVDSVCIVGCSGAVGKARDTLPKFKSEFSPEKLPKPNRKGDRLPTFFFQGKTRC